MRVFVIVLAFVFLCSCNQQSGKEKAKSAIKNEITGKTDSSYNTTFKKTFFDDSVSKIVIPKNTLQIVTNEKPDSLSHIYLLGAGSFNEDNFSSIFLKLRWDGLFKEKEHYCVKPAKVTFSREQAEMDTDGQKTGWLVKCNDEKNNIALISGVENLNIRPIKGVLLSRDTLYPGQKEEFKYNGVNYTLYATGNKKNNITSNYKLFLMANVKGHNFNQLLTSTESFGNGWMTEYDEMIKIKFIGDIDGDNIPDILIDYWSTNYGFTNLYLSKPAGDKAILKYMANYGGTD